MEPTRPFVQFLTFCLDETELFTREEWCTRLQVDAPLIEQWLSDLRPPSALEFREIISLLLTHLRDSALTVCFQRLHQVEWMPIEEFSQQPIEAWERVRNLAEYLNLPLMQSLQSHLNGVSLLQRDNVLHAAILHAHQHQDGE